MSRTDPEPLFRAGENPDPPSNVRHFVVFSCTLMAVLLYVDRYCVSMVEPYIKQDLNLSTFQIGFFFSAFFLTYALCQVPAGWLSDRFGARIMLVVYVLTWSFFTAMMGFSYGFVMLLTMRAAYGIGQAGAYPTSASVVSKWVPFAKRGTASSFVALGGRLGGAIAPLLTAYLIVLWVPVTDNSSRFQIRDLLDGPALCNKLCPTNPSESKNPTRNNPSQSSGARRVWELLSPETQRQLQTIATAFRPVEPKMLALKNEGKSLQSKWQFFAAREKFRRAETLKIELTPEQSNLIVSSLNLVLQNKNFYRKGIFTGLDLDSSARKYRKRVAKGETLTSAESERFHRLLLESIFSAAVKEVYGAGWRPVMISYGLLGLVVASLLGCVLRNRPEQHPFCNQAERSLISTGRPAETPSPYGKVGSVPWAPMLKNWSLWCVNIENFGANIGWAFLLTWFPRYLFEVHHVPIVERGLMTSIPLFVGWLGILGGGRLTDFLVTRVGLRWSRRLPLCAARLFAALAFFSCTWLDSAWAVTAALAFLAFSNDLASGPKWAFYQDIGGSYVGSVHGWCNMWGNLGGTISPILLAWVFESWGWNEMFFVGAGAFFIASVMCLGIDATSPVAPADEKD